MKIRTQFIITMFLFGIMLAIIAVSAIITTQLAGKVSKQEKIASSIAQGASELSYLSNDYLIYRESQQLKRWQTRFASFSSQVASLSVDRPEQQALVRNIQANQQRLKEVFDSVVSASGSPSRDRVAPFDPALLQVSWSRMAVQSQGLVSDASRLSQLFRDQVDRLQRINMIVVVGLVGILAAYFFVNYIVIQRHTLRSIRRLQAGTAVIGSANLDYIIEEGKNDEIGDLSRAFNQMTLNLKAVTASKQDLEREVAQRKQAEEELRRQREWLGVTLSSIGDGVIASDAEGRITFLNPIAVTLTGWESEEALGQPVQDVFRIINEKTHAAAEGLVARVLSEKRVVGLANDTALITRDGREVPIEDSAAPIKDSAGNIIGVVLVFHDVTEKRRAQEALRKSEARYRSYIEVTEQLAWTTNAEGGVAEDIPAWRKFTGQSEQQVKGWGWSGALHPDDLEQTARVWRNAVATKSRYETEYRIRRYDGVYRHFLALGVPVFKGNGAIREWVGTCIDITERKRAEEGLRESEARLNRSQEIAHLGSWELDLINNRLTWSDEVYRIFGLQPQEFGATYGAFLEAVHPDDRTAVDAAYSGSVREGRDTYEIEHRVVRKSTGEIRTVHERCAHIRDASRRIIRSIGMVHDITERKQAAEALQQRTIELQQLTETLEQQVQERTEDLEGANQALRSLSTRLLSTQEEERKRVAGELHDTIGACLSGIKFKVESSLQQMGKTQNHMTESLKTIIPVIQEGIEDCRRMQQDLRPSMLDDLGLLPTLSWFCRRYQTIYTGIRVELEQTLEEREIPNSLKIVIYRVTQEGMNNIAKHSKADLVRLFLRKMGGRIELILEDNGQGFDLKKVLGSESTNRGLGLTSMRERTELSGGSFAIESAKGKGTIIRASWKIDD